MDNYQPPRHAERVPPLLEKEGSFVGCTQSTPSLGKGRWLAEGETEGIERAGRVGMTEGITSSISN